MDTNVELPPVVDQAKAVPEASSVAAEASKEVKAEAAKPGPADDLRLLQQLLINGLFPGNVAPQITKGYQLLEAMAQKIEAEAKANEAK